MTKTFLIKILQATCDISFLWMEFFFMYMLEGGHFHQVRWSFVHKEKNIKVNPVLPVHVCVCVCVCVC